MTRKAKFWLLTYSVFAAVTLLAPLFVSFFDNPFTSQAMAFATGGPFNLGYDYIGRPILPQLFTGGRDLLLSASLTAVLARLIGLFFGIVLANRNKATKVIRFLLDAVLVIPAVVVSLTAFNAFSGSIYAIIPISILLNVPFTSRYYESNVYPLLQSTFYEYAMLREKSQVRLILQEIIPVMRKNILTDISSSFISATYMFSSISFIGTYMDNSSFLWPKMLSENLGGFSLNPWAALAPLLCIVFLTAPLSFFVDAMEREKK